MAFVDWYIEGKQFGNCNCVDGCPCQFEGIPTNGGCTGFEVLHIDKGHYGEVKLDGLRHAIIYRWPGPIYEGKGEMQAIIDERADELQRNAINTIIHGGETAEAATHWWVFHAMSDTVYGTLFKPIEFDIDIDARTARVSIPGVMDSTGYPIKSPHSDNEHRVRIDIPGGIEFEFAEIGKASTKASGKIPLDLTDTYGQFSVLRHSPTGIVH